MNCIHKTEEKQNATILSAGHNKANGLACMGLYEIMRNLLNKDGKKEKKEHE